MFYRICVIHTIYINRLFRAGQMAERNLQESQSKIKYGTTEKQSQGQGVLNLEILVLFPVVGNPLQNALDLIKWLRKLVTQITWSELQKTQVFHINMLKAYHEKPKPKLVTLNNRLGLESLMHSESCVGLKAEKEEDNESDVGLGNDQQPIKLQNSQILNNLGTKMSHLPSVQRKELAEVINQYREVFFRCSK